MSMFRLPNLQSIASKIERLRERFSHRRRRGISVSESTFRRLMVDPLEERQLLSLSAGHVDDMLVNQSIIDPHADEDGLATSPTLAGQSLAGDNDGDFVVVWTRYDEFVDANGDPIIDPATQDVLTDANVYARYFTDEVQRITLPAGVTNDNVDGNYGTFSLRYGGNEVQKISITASYMPAFDPESPYSYDYYNYTSYQPDISGSFVLGFDVDGNGVISSGTETATIIYEETPPLDLVTGLPTSPGKHLRNLADRIETALRALPTDVGNASDVTVEAVNAHEFLIHFGDASEGMNQPELTVEDFQFTTGFLPAVTVTTEHEPIEITDIPVSPDHPELTALALQQKFAFEHSSNYLIGPIDFPPPDRVDPASYSWLEAPYYAPQVIRTSVPEISVSARSATEFEITFTGDSGKRDHPELEVLTVSDEMGNVLHDHADPLLVSPEVDVITLKEPSSEFRVNPEEPDDPFTYLPDTVDQLSPAVAMDTDGDFVIVWQQDVPDLVAFGSVSDIYARRFTPVGLPTDSDLYVPGQVVPGVRALPTPESKDTQILTFQALGTLPLQGEFQLKIGKKTTEIIPFDSDDLPGVATAIEDALVAAGYEGVEVTPVSGTNPYKFEAFFNGRSAGVDQPPIEYVPVMDPITALPLLDASFTNTDASGDMYTFLVNTSTTNAQFDPSVGMDHDGNFTIAWANHGQDFSYFNGISAQRYDRHGNPMGTEFQVNTEDTSIHFDPYVSMSVDGYTGITWTATDDEDYLAPGSGYLSAVRGKILAPDGTEIEDLGSFGAGGATSTFDLANNFLVVWQEDSDLDNIGGDSVGVRARMWSMDETVDPVTGAVTAVTATVIRDVFRANSANHPVTQTDPDVELLWPNWQGFAHVGVDADGDIVIAYDGFGPDVSEDLTTTASVYYGDPTGTFSSTLQAQINAEKNADLLPFFDPTIDDLGSFSSYSYYYYYADSMAVTAAIEQVLIQAAYSGATDQQLGRLRAILDDSAGLLRGEANGILFSRWDADPEVGPMNVLYSDCIANAHRDGQNARYFIAIDRDVSGGSVDLRVRHPFRTGWDDVSFDVNLDNDVFDPVDTARNIEVALEENASRTGIQWEYPEQADSTPYSGPVTVRPLYSYGGIGMDDELTIRDGTPWDLTPEDPFGGMDLEGPQATDFYFEITFQGEVHDTPAYFYVAPRGNHLTAEAVDEIQILGFDVTTDGWFALQIGTDTTDDILFDSSDSTTLDQVAADIADALNALDDYDGITVTYSQVNPLTGEYEFEVTFAGDSGGENQPRVWEAFAQNNTPRFFGNITSTEETPGRSDQARAPVIFTHTAADPGTVQEQVSIGMQPDGDFVLAWTQHDEFTSGAGGFFADTYGTSNDNIYFRTFDESTDTAGPIVTDLISGDGLRVDAGAMIEGPVTHIVLTFDDDLLEYSDERLSWAMQERDLALELGQTVPSDVSAVLDSVTNPENYRLMINGIELVGGIMNVEFGLNKAAELAGQIDPVTGQPYDLDPVPTNKWEAVFTLDGDVIEPGVTPLSYGLYTIEALAPVGPTGGATSTSGLRDKARNPLGHTGYTQGGANYTRDFVVTVRTSGVDTPVTEDSALDFPGRTHPETPGAVAVDADGDHVVVWTVHDPTLDLDRVYVRMYNADGDPAQTPPARYPFEVTPYTSNPSDPDYAFVNDQQRHASVAADADGDFVVTWSNFRDTDGDGQYEEQDVYARRYAADGTPISEAFRVNTYVDDAQKWSSVAMDTDGDFVITWSSYGQEEATGRNGYGYGVYARRYDSSGVPLSAEFRVNVTTAGNQQYPSVAMDTRGGFIVTWTSDQGGAGDDVYARAFAADGAPLPTDDALSGTGSDVGPYQGEFRVNVTTDGNQRWSDVAVDLAGQNIAITWSSSGGQDTDGWGVYTRVFSIDASGTVTANPATATDVLVNTSVTGDQRFSSVAMNHQRDIIIAWSGLGDRPRQEDSSGYGVFYQRYSVVDVLTDILDPDDGSVIGQQLVPTLLLQGSETRGNITAAGNQWLPSVAADGEGNFVLVWTGDTAVAGSTDVYRMLSIDRLPVPDLDGPLVTDVLWVDAGGNRISLIDGDVLQPPAGVNRLTFAFSEHLSLVDGAIGLESVINPDNWVLERNGTELLDAITGVTFRRNPLTRKHEAVVSFDGNGLDPGVIPLAAADYTLTLRDTVTDGINALDADFDGVPGTDLATAGLEGYRFAFSVADGPQYGPEFRVNQIVPYIQQLGENRGSGWGLDESTRSVAVDHDGDYVVVWTSYGQDDPADPIGAGVYFRMYNRDNVALTAETRVNTTVVGHQRNAAVAIDADGEFVVAWEGQNSGDGSWDVYARRFDAMGQPVLSDTNVNNVIDSSDTALEFRVNTETMGDQFNPAVAVDSVGNFVVTYSSTFGQDWSYFYHNLYAQRYNNQGKHQGVEFMVNAADIPAPPTDMNSSVAMDDAGNVIVVWTQWNTQTNGVPFPVDTSVISRTFDATSTPTSGEANEGTGRNPQVIMDATGAPVIVWEDGGDIQTNRVGVAHSVIGGNQVNPSVAIDGDGDLAIVWSGYGYQPDPTDPTNPELWVDEDPEGIFIRYFNAANQPVSEQWRVNRTESGAQRFPSIAMEPDGDAIVVWSGAGVGDQHGIFARRYDEPTDTFGPLATELRLPNGTLIRSGGPVRGSQFDYNDDNFVQPSQIVVVFDEQMRAAGADSVTNPENWVLNRNGVEVQGAIVGISFALNASTNKWEALIDFGSPLPAGSYTLTALQPIAEVPDTPQIEGRSGLRDMAGNPLARTGVTPAGASVSHAFSVALTGADTSVTGALMVQNSRTHGETRDSLAVDADGDHVVVWSAEDVNGRDRVFVRAYQANGDSAQTPYAWLPFEVTPSTSNPSNPNYAFNNDLQRSASVASDADGDFIVTWTNFRDVNGDGNYEQEDVYARRFRANGEALGDAFRVNTYTGNAQRWSSVAMDTDGDFVITWSSYGQEGSTTGQGGLGYGVYARLYDSLGEPLAPEFLVNQATAGNQQYANVVMDANGNSLFTWTSRQNGANDDVYVRAFDAVGIAISGETLVNTTAAGNQTHSDVAVDLSGQNFVASWSSSGGQDGDGLGVYARLFGLSAAGITPNSAELPVNASTTGDQTYSSVSMDHQGRFVVAWSGRGDQPFQQDLSGSGVYYRAFDAAGVALGGETRVNIVTAGNQWAPGIGSDGEGNFVVAWTGQTVTGGPTSVYRFLSTDYVSATDADGPIVTDVTLANGTRLLPGTLVDSTTGGSVSSLIVVFGENLSTREIDVDDNGTLDEPGPDSVLNPQNWALYSNGTEITHAITGVLFRHNPLSRKYEAVVTFDGNGLDSGTPALPGGSYVLVVRDSIHDVYIPDVDGNFFGGNALDADFDGVPGTALPVAGEEGYRIEFAVASTDTDVPVGVVNGRTHPETPGAVATDADGDHVVVWTVYDQALQRDRVYVRLYDADGSPASAPQAQLPFEVTPYTTQVDDADHAFNGDHQRHGAVAVDADGDFVVTWTNLRDVDGDGVHEEQDVYARRYRADGTAMGDAFRVNTYADGVQKWSSVAMDVDGDFVIAWSSYGQEEAMGRNGYGYGIYARRYNSSGTPLSAEFRVNVTTAGNQQYPSVAMDGQSGFVVSWTSDQGGAGDDVYARAFAADGTPVPVGEVLGSTGSDVGAFQGEFRVNLTTNGNQRYSDVAVDLAGNTFVFTWSSSDGQDGEGWGVYARTLGIDAAGDLTPTTPPSGEILVNTTIEGDQKFSSAAMDHQGNFVVAWSGFGDQTWEADDSDSGVFYQRFNSSVAGVVRVGGETRGNITTQGNQWLPSVAMDGTGNFVLVWTGSNTTGSSDVFRLLSIDRVPMADTDGPLVTDVLWIDPGNNQPIRLFSGDVLQPSSPGIYQFTFVFSEALSTIDGQIGLESIANPDNWVLQHNGAEVVDGIVGVSFGLNSTTRKYEATVSFDGNGANANPGGGPVALPAGDFSLTLRDSVTDGANALDADYDGVPGTDLATAGLGGFQFRFSVANGPQFYQEYRVNQSTSFLQRLGEARGTGWGLEQSNQTVAVDHDGDYVVVWTSYGQDDPNDPVGAGVYYRMYNRNNVPRTPETLVNTTVVGHQRNATVAMDADGDFVIAWEAQDPLDGSWDVYARRFNATGQPVVSDTNNNQAIDAGDTNLEFRVNTATMGDQFSPAVAVNTTGDFVVTYSTTFGQDWSYFFHNLYARRYDYQGIQQGLEFMVNAADIPAPPTDMDSAVAMDDNGNLVVVWTQWNSQTDGVPFPTNVSVISRSFDVNDAATTAETTVGAGRNPQLVLDSAGSPIIVWDSGGANPDVLSNVVGVVHTVNAGSQVNPSVGVDADGDLAIVWNGNGYQPDPINPANAELWVDPDSEGVFIRHFNPLGTAVSQQWRVNRTEGGIQQFPSIAMEPDGDHVVVWSGAGVGDRSGIFARRYDEPTDTAGPLVTELRLANGPRLSDSEPVSGPLSELVVIFDEELSTTGSDSVTNPDNWVLARGGIELDVIGQIGFNLNSATNKWEAVISLNSPLIGGHYTLTARHPIAEDPATPEIDGQSGLRDKAGNPLLRTGVFPDGGSYSMAFWVGLGGGDVEVASNAQTYPETSGAVASDADGDHVVAVTYQTGGLDRAYVRLYEADGSDATTQPSAFFAVTTESQFAGDQQRHVAVASDADGDFVVTWTNYRDANHDGQYEDVDVYARRFNAEGDPQGLAFRVNDYTANDQKWSDVAMDLDGDFVVTWTSYAQETNGQLGSGYGIYARRYDSFGLPRGAESRVNTTTAGNQQTPSVAMDAQGGYVIVWTSDQNGIGDDIVGRSYYPDGTPVMGLLGSELLINQTTTGNQRYPDVDMDLSGRRAVVTWSSFGQDGSGWGVYGIVLERENLDPLVPGQPPTQTFTADPTLLPMVIPDPGTARSPLVVNQSLFIYDVNVNLTILHPDPDDLEIYLISPNGTRIALARNVPRRLPGNVKPPGSDFMGTTFDDDLGSTLITNPTGSPPAVPDFSGTWVPEQLLREFDGENAQGTWYLEIIDEQPGNRGDVSYPAITDGRGILDDWSLTITRAPTAPEFPVNTTTQGNQIYSSVAVDHFGGFTVAWSGIGDQDYQQDGTDYGVFYQQFDAAALPLPAGGEVRVNRETIGNQWIPSVDNDGQGNFVIAWTGEGSVPGATDVYRFLSGDIISTDDNDGPLVTDVLGPNGDRLLPGYVACPSVAVTEVTVAFSEDLSVRGGTAGLDSVLNPANWTLERNGAEIVSGIRAISFQRNPDTRKYEAVLSLDGNGMSPGVTPLSQGEYVVTIHQTIRDDYLYDAQDPYFGGNPLSGSFDLGAFTDPGGTGETPYQFSFSVVTGSQVGPEMRVNGNTNLIQQISEPAGTGLGQENSTRSLAVDHDGDFVVVWTAYGQADPNSADVYLRLYDRHNNPLTGEVLVNTNMTAGQQRNAAVAMDADGDFVVVWESEESPGSGMFDVFAQRYRANGEAIGSVIQVNTETYRDQHHPAVGMNSFGDFVVTWASTVGQDFSFFHHNIYAQRYDRFGKALGQNFRVNEIDVPVGGPLVPGSLEGNPAVAVRDDRSFVVVWEGYSGQDGMILDSNIIGRIYGPTGAPRVNPITGTAGEFQVDVSDDAFVTDAAYHSSPEGASGGTIGDTGRRTARNPQIAVDGVGNFIVVWESFHDNDVDSVAGADSYGVYFREFFADGTPLRDADHQANLVITTTAQQTAGGQPLTVPDPLVNSDKYALAQVNPSIAIDADGDFAVVWNGNGATADQVDPDNPTMVSEWDREGVFIRSFHASYRELDLDGDGAPDPVIDTDGDGVPDAPLDDILPAYVTPQSRVNRTSGGVQQFPTIGMEPDGDKIVVWSGVGVGDSHGIFVRRYDEASDTAGPMATELRQTANGLLIGGADQLAGPLQQVTVVFDEEMATSGPGSVLNRANWTVLDAAGVPVSNAVANVQFGLNAATNKWEAVLTFSGTGLANGYYELIAGEHLTDVVGNELRFSGLLQSSDTDPIRRTSFGFGVTGAGAPGVGVEFPINQWPQGFDQTFSEIFETGSGQEQSNRTVAVDNDGDFVVVWTSYGQDDPGDPDGGGVFFRLFNSNNEPLTNEIQVNVFTEGQQRNANVAMDADGDFVIVWESEGQNPGDGWDVYARRYNSVGTAVRSDTNLDLKVDELDNNLPFRVHSDGTNDQRKPAVAMDDYGNFVVVWGTAEQDFSYFRNIYAQLYDYAGREVGDAFMVNTADLPGVGGYEMNPAVAMDSVGNFVVAWEQVTTQANGIVTDSIIMARLFDPTGTLDPSGVALLPEFQADGGAGQGGQVPSVARTARNPQVAMGDAGNFYLADEFYVGVPGTPLSGYGIECIKYDLTGTVVPSSWVSPPLPIPRDGALNWVNPSVAVDADGDYAWAYNGHAAQFDPDDPTNPMLVTGEDDEGVFVMFIDSANELVSPYTRVNRTTDGVQQFPSLAMEPDGDLIVVWSGYGPGDQQGVFARRYNETSDSAGPLATELRLTDGTLVADGDNVFYNPTQLVVVFDERMAIGGDGNVENPNNWALVRGDGTEVQGVIFDIDFGLNKAYEMGLPGAVIANKWEAVITFDGNSAEGGFAPSTLPNGQYTLIARSALTDVVGNPLARSGYRPEGTAADALGTPATDPATSPTGGLAFRFRVHETLPQDPNPGDVDTSVHTTLEYDQNGAAVARSPRGDYVVVWVSQLPVVDPNAPVDPTQPTPPTTFQTDIVAQRFDAFSRPIGAEFVVNSIVLGNQSEPDVAMDAEGNFVVTWSGAGELLGDASGIFAQRFNKLGEKVGGQFRVNGITSKVQKEPSVAMDLAGAFVVSWTSDGQDGSFNGVFARQYSAAGQPLSSEFQVNTTWTNSQQTSDVAMDADGDFVVVWAAQGQDSSGACVVGRRYNRSGQAQGGEFRVNQYEFNNQTQPAVSMSYDGGFVVAWASFFQEQDADYGIYARRYANTGAALGDEFHVNTHTASRQHQPDVAMDHQGRFVVVWTSYDQDDNPENAEVLHDDGIYARIFAADGSDYVGPGGGPPVGEFRVNALTDDNQVNPAVAWDANNHFVVVWTGQDPLPPTPDPVDPTDPNAPVVTVVPNGSGIYSRLLDPPGDITNGLGADGPTATVLTVSGRPDADDVFEFIGGPTPSSWIVKLNGVAQEVAATLSEVRFDGLGGHDTVKLTGTVGDETVVLWPDHGTMAGNNYLVTVTNVESIDAYGLGGDDHVTFYDGPGNDTFGGGPNGAAMDGPGVDNYASGFETVIALAEAGGQNVAKFFDSAGDDEFWAGPLFGRLEGDGFSLEARRFTAVHGYSSVGGFDVARMYDSAGNDKFTGTAIDAALFGDGFYNRVKNFDAVHAFATAGGIDEAKLIDSAGNDKFYGSPVEGSLYGEGFYNRAKYFEGVHAYAVNGGIDEAKLYDSAANDKLVTTYCFAALYDPGQYYNRAMHFEGVYAYALEGGVDEAKMFDSPGNDEFVATPEYGALYGNGFYNRAVGFDGVHAYATAGGVDEAKLYDSAEDDIFYATPEEGALFKPGKFYNRAKHFDGVHAFATAGGVDLAKMYDSQGDNKFVGEADSHALFGDGFYNRAKYFEQIEAHAEAGGDDTAVLYDAVLENGRAAAPGGNSKTVFAKVAWLYDFEECLTANGTSDDDPVEQAVDAIFTAYWE
ncbi:MAG: proprotein convertase P-domain-containing protein [Pirellulales bacterium]|nr:proprotein convertase P-domain-containing protein [Pirellulales bacterium]